MGKIDRDLVQSLDWNLLKIFDAIVQSGGIARAAQRLNRQQPADDQVALPQEATRELDLGRPLQRGVFALL